MGTGFGGTFVISWSQTEIDGLDAAPIASLTVGATWAWRGDAVRVDGPAELLQLGQADGEQDIRKRAARMVRRLVGIAMSGARDLTDVDIDDAGGDSAIVVTDGAQTYTITMIEVGAGAAPLLMFMGQMPPRDSELWVVHQALDALVERTVQRPSFGGVICFTPGTRIATPEGMRLVEELCEGDRVLTRDNGSQPVEWIGSRRMSGARLFAMPHLRPVRIRASALGSDHPDQDLVVSPDHRVLITGRAARDLFNTPEVLVAARDLINGSTVAVDTALREVTYVHLLLPSHQVLWANGVQSESFHPASAALGALDDADRARLLATHPALDVDPGSYGEHARRLLSAAEAAILFHAA